MEILGIDIGGSGIKGAPVDVAEGALLAERYRISTPQPATPEAVSDTVAKIIQYFEWDGLVGCTFPAIIKNGRTLSAANVDDGWIGLEAEKLLRRKTGCSLLLINDADAAGIAEMEFGAGRDHREGVVMVLTLGTGIGSALFVDGNLWPNTELGHIFMGSREAERWASDRVRREKGLKWKQWGERINAYLQHLEFLFSPDVFIIGGGVSKKFEKFAPAINVNAQLLPAQLLNDAGIVGAAMAARRLAR
jgi:polyphosphate glucokinase